MCVSVDVDCHTVWAERRCILCITLQLIPVCIERLGLRLKPYFYHNGVDADNRPCLSPRQTNST